MRRQAHAIALAAILSVVGVFGAPAGPAAADQWGPWSCGGGINNYPVTGGTMNGRGCASWWECSCYTLNWMVWADTSVPQSYSIYTSADGYDRCDSNAYVYEGSVRNTVYNNTYGTSNPSSALPYLDCASNGHTYKVRDYSLRQPNSPSDGWEGTEGAVFWGPGPY